MYSRNYTRRNMKCSLHNYSQNEEVSMKNIFSETFIILVSFQLIVCFCSCLGIHENFLICQRNFFLIKARTYIFLDCLYTFTRCSQDNRFLVPIITLSCKMWVKNPIEPLMKNSLVFRVFESLDDKSIVWT